MKRVVGVREAEGMLRSRADLVLLGWSDRRIAAAVAAGEIIRVHRGWYVLRSNWDEMWPEGRHMIQIVAATREMVGGAGAVSLSSAGVLHGIPLYRTRLNRVHVTGTTDMQASSSGVVHRHEERLSADDVTMIDGILCTTLERTAFDLARLLSVEAAVAAADAALAMVATNSHVQDPDLVSAWRDRMRQRAMDAGAIRGVRQARRVIEFADGGAQLPGESVTRLQLARLGFGTLRTQVPVVGPDGKMYWVDVGLEEVGAFTEFDGESKYLDEAMRAGKTLERVLLDEKRREDWIRGTTQRRFGRCGDADIVTPLALGRRLASFGIVPPR